MRLKTPGLLMVMVLGSVLVRGLTTTEAAKRKVTREPMPEPQAQQEQVVVRPRGLDAEAINFINTHYVNKTGSTTFTGKATNDSGETFTNITTSIITPVSLTIDANGNIELVEKVKEILNQPEGFKWNRIEGTRTTTSRGFLANLSTNVLVKGETLKLECMTGNCWEFTNTELKVVFGKTTEGNDEKKEIVQPYGKSQFATNYLLASSEEMAQRLAKAFSDLIRSAGGPTSKY